jgi:hypothetical protein
MAIDIVAIDRAIAKLQELRRLASDPDVAPFLRNGASPPKAANEPAYDTALGVAVINAYRDIPGDFTVNIIYERMKDTYKFRGTEPRKSVANVLRSLARDGQVRIKQQGKGRRETIYTRNTV